MALNIAPALSLLLCNIVRFVALPFKTVMSKSNRPEVMEVVLLSSRLATAESQLAVLQREIDEIKQKIAVIQKNCGILGDVNENKNNILLAKRVNDTVDNSNDSFVKKRKFDFTNENDYVVVYTDGACENNGRLNAKAGIGVWFGEDHPLNISKPVEGRATNNTAEIQACIAAIKTAHSNGIKKLKIKTDSQFVISSITQWIHKWKRNNWKVVSGADVKNKEDFMVLDESMRKLEDIKWEHINGHCGIRGNEQADRLARLGALQYSCTKAKK